MAEIKQSLLFTKNAAEKLRAPDDLEKYVQVTRPSMWIVTCACASLLVGLLIWGMLGTVSTNVSTMGVVIDDQPICFLDAEDVVLVQVGDAVRFGGKPMKVTTVASIPMSREEVGRMLRSDYLVSALIGGDWGYRITLEGDADELAQRVPLSVSITTKQTSPISVILENKG